MRGSGQSTMVGATTELGGFKPWKNASECCLKIGNEVAAFGQQQVSKRCATPVARFFINNVTWGVSRYHGIR